MYAKSKLNGVNNSNLKKKNYVSIVVVSKMATLSYKPALEICIAL